MSESQNKPSINTEQTSKRKPYKKRTKEREYGILIVEDETTWSSLYKTNLKGLLDQKRKYRIFEAQNAKEALRIIAQYYDRIDIILLDLILGIERSEQPEGMALLEELYDQLGLTDFAIFIFTAYANQSIEDWCRLRGVRYIWDKSEIDFVRLANLIDEYITLAEKPKGIDTGFYIELRKQIEQRYLYLRWVNEREEKKSFVLGKTEDIERIGLPNIKTDLNNIENWKPKD